MKTINLFIVLPLLLIVVMLSSCSKSPETIYVNGKIYTFDKDNNIVEAVAVKEGQIYETGKSEELKKKFEKAEVIDLQGKTVVPGFTDSDGSLILFAQNLSNTNLLKFESRKAIEKIITESKNRFKPGTWIGLMFYGGEEATADSIAELSRKYLDDIAPEHCVYLIDVTYNIALCNSAMLNAIRITPTSESPENGSIEKNDAGELTGFLFNDATSLINPSFRTYTKENMFSLVEIASNELLKYGIVSVQDRTINKESITLFRQLIDSNKLPIRIYGVLSTGDEAYKEYITKGIEKDYKEKLSVRSVSIDYDGAFEYQLASMFDEYKTKNKVNPSFSSDEALEEFLIQAYDKKFQVNIKAVGDKAVNNVLNVIEKVQKAKNPKDHRTRIEHLEFAKKEDIARLKNLGIIPSVRPEVVMEDMQIVPLITNEANYQNMGMWKSMLESAGILNVGSDFPFQQINPLVQMYYLITRQVTDTTDKLTIPNPEQKISITDALKAYTIWASYTAFEEEIRGSIEKGKYADFVVLSEDILTSQPQVLLKTKVLKTIVAGKIVYSAEK